MGKRGKTGEGRVQYVVKGEGICGPDGIPYRQKQPDRLAQIDSLPLLSAEQAQKLLSGYILARYRLDKDKLAALKLLGESLGLWGPGKKLTPEPRAAPSIGVVETDTDST